MTPEHGGTSADGETFGQLLPKRGTTYRPKGIPAVNATRVERREFCRLHGITMKQLRKALKAIKREGTRGNLRSPALPGKKEYCKHCGEILLKFDECYCYPENHHD